MVPFVDLSSRQQIAALRPAVRDAMRQFGLDGARFRLAYHGYNTTFRVDSAEGSYALRINVGSNRTLEQIRGEAEWVRYLTSKEGVSVAQPRPTVEGDWVAQVQVPNFDHPKPAVAYRWVDGRHMKGRLSLENARKIGSAMSRLHRYGLSFRFPQGASRPVLPDVLDGLPWGPPNTSLWRDALGRAQEAMDRLAKRPRQLVHFDIHLGNLKQSAGNITVFDFDDSLMAWPVMDVAQSMFYMRRLSNAEAVEDAIWRGMEMTLDDFSCSRFDFESLVAGRALLLGCDLVQNQNSTLRAMSAEYLANTEARLLGLEKTGRFDTRITA